MSIVLGRRDPYKLTKGNVILDIRSLFLGSWIIPSGVLQSFAIHIEIIVAGGPLPGTERVSIRVTEERLINGTRWEVDVALDCLIRVGRGNHFAGNFGGCGRHFQTQKSCEL